ncbi:MAG TPA: beta-N-acetylglucosaminidase domain-containing protein [Methylomirabilota bacterium]|nr:beta-N-acetylglucosaminidase domain-containing protein [Methylomirabilota bacterium]
MMAREADPFLAGVIEGFYGPPWSPAERVELFDWMAKWGLNTYLYAPKDDLKHRTLWRELYSPEELTALGRCLAAANQRGLRFIYAIGPGLDIRYSRETDLDHLRARFEQMMQIGCRHFALLFDDIPDRMETADAKRWGSFAAAQCHLVNAMWRWTRERVPKARFLFCPTPYCGRMAVRQLGGAGYLATVGKELEPDIDVFWTGPEIISNEIEPGHVREVAAILRRKPVIWDNLHANDYDGRRFYCGPYSGRPPELRHEVAGILSNPNTEFPLNYVPLRTLATFLQSPSAWTAREAYLSAMQEWLAHFAVVGQPVTLEDLVLFGDCYYLPCGEGPEAAALCARAQRLVTLPPQQWGEDGRTFQQQATRLRDFCGHLAGLRDRALFQALHRRAWELREELDLLLSYVRSRQADPRAPFCSDFHLPGTYRGGMVARLQRLLTQRPDGTFVPGTGTSERQAAGGPITTLP